MSWRILCDKDVQDFIHAHLDADVKTLALQKWPSDTWPRPLILDQIKARQKAVKKLPHLLAYPDIILPPADLVEQASSTATARYKASLFAGQTVVDLTAGCGIDSWALAQNFKRLIGVERDSSAAALLEHNLNILHPHQNITIHNASAEEFVTKMPDVDLVYIDPQRRHDHKRGLFKFEECSPNIQNLIPALLRHTSTIMIKASPMLSIEHTVQSLPHIQHVYVIELQDQCKEILFTINALKEKTPTQIQAVRLNNDGTVYDSVTAPYKRTDRPPPQYAQPMRYLYEPAPAYQKADLVDTIATQFSCAQLAPGTNLLTSDTYIENFPGRSFKIIGQIPPHKKSLPFDKANLTVRNFPSSVEELRKKLKLKEGGDEYLFACTLLDGRKILLHTHKEIVNRSSDTIKAV